MTAQSDHPENQQPDSADAHYSVGYGRPPKEHQFQKGRSGNPLGRPRKPRPPQKQGRVSFGELPANQILLQEAYRPVLVREGEHTSELPAIQAVFRAMGVAAMKGNRFAQRTLAELVQSVETESRKLRDDHFKSAINYKCTWEEEIERASQMGRPIPQPVPHPDDIIINFRTGEATVCGPMTKQDKAEWEAAFRHLDQLQSEISRHAADFRKSRSEETKADALEMWKFNQKLFDRLNDNLPKRYRKYLEHRCWEKGASIPGQQCRHLWPDED